VAPLLALQALFAQRGITVSVEGARRDMGLLKRNHIQAIFALPDLRARWCVVTGSEPAEADVHSLFAEFGPLQIEIVAEPSQLISGVAETVRNWQSQELRIGSSTGYTRQMLAPVLAHAIGNGYRPDASVCPDEGSAGRPASWMPMKNAQFLNVYPPSACVKIGDSVVDIEEGRNAGMWNIGLTRAGNLVGLDEQQWAQLPETKQMDRLRDAKRVLRMAGADDVADDLASCDEVLAEIEARLSCRT
jgi:phosphonoacetaldehyde hydrolase